MKIETKEAEKIVAFYRKGNSLTATAGYFGRNYNTVQKLVAEEGASRPRGRVSVS